ncbi:uncharacterized protein TNCV_3868561 [Trichonephila clavipes]|nr:uncharacterized protein TNCV_3868561 [Trichonephila clavipes]
MHLSVCDANYCDETQGQEWVQCFDSCSSWFHEKCVELEEDLPLSDHQNVWFHYDLAPLHNVSYVIRYIRDKFQLRVIGYGSCVDWPARSPDLNPPDFTLWRYIKQ